MPFLTAICVRSGPGCLSFPSSDNLFAAPLVLVPFCSRVSTSRLEELVFNVIQITSPFPSHIILSLPPPNPPTDEYSICYPQATAPFHILEENLPVMTSTMAAFAHLSARNLDEFAPTCPSESQWYACPAESPSTFVGCCSTDPCASQNGCSQGNIRPVSFNASTHDTPAFPPDASCGTGSNFYTCIAGEAGDATVQTFWGCCKSNPCGETLECPAGELVSAYMGTPSQVQAYTGEGASSSPSPSSSASPSPSAEASSGTNKSTAIIIGGAAGGAAVFLAFLAFLIFWFCRRRKARSRTSTPDVPLTTRTAKSSAWPSEKSSVYKGAAQGSEESRISSVPSCDHTVPLTFPSTTYIHITRSQHVSGHARPHVGLQTPLSASRSASTGTPRRTPFYLILTSVL